MRRLPLRKTIRRFSLKDSNKHFCEFQQAYLLLYHEKTLFFLINDAKADIHCTACLNSERKGNAYG